MFLWPGPCVHFQPEKCSIAVSRSAFQCPPAKLFLFAHLTQAISNNHGDFASSGSVSRIDSTCESDEASPNILPARASHILVLEIKYQCLSALLMIRFRLD